MNSKLFRRFDLKAKANDGFLKAIKDAVTLTSEQVDALFAFLPQIIQAETSNEVFPIINKLEEEAQLSPTVIQKVTDFASFILKAFGNTQLDGDTPELWAEDLVSAQVLDADKKEIFIQFVTSLREKCLTTVEEHGRVRNTEAGALPVFSGISTTIEVRGVLKKQFEWGTDVESFVPEITGLIPIISIGLSVDSGPTKSFTFQATPKDIQYLIDELKAAQKSAQKLIDHVNIH